MKGILFKPNMIKAIVEERKTVTRRLDSLKEINKEPDRWVYQDAPYRLHRFDGIPDGFRVIVKPHYQVGEVVYIKEAYRCIDFDLRDIDEPLRRIKVEYKNGETLWRMKPKEKPITIPDKWHSPMMMPEWAARYFIKITDVRAERLQEITYEDCGAEGIYSEFHCGDLDGRSLTHADLIKQYCHLWDSINPKYPWSSNCWVFRYQFERVEK